MSKEKLIIGDHTRIDPNVVIYDHDFRNRYKDGYITSSVFSGKVSFDNSVEVLKKYFLLLFLTQYYTEEITGTIIDAFCVGVPVIAAKWEN